MKTLKEQFINSSKELKSLKNVILISLLLALSTAIGSFTLAFGNYIKIGFSSLVNEFAYMLFGPAVGIIFGMLSDILNYIVKPTGAFFPGFTLNAMIAGMIYGIILYKKNITFKRVFVAKLIVTLVVNLGLTTFWLCIMYGNSFMAIFPLRCIKNFIMLPINSILLFTLIKCLEKPLAYVRYYKQV